jgi:predicted DNA-binding antitoxin AbrB/MazE fold protein
MEEDIMGKPLEVIYENGVLRPLEPIDLEEHQRYSIEIVHAAGDEPALDEEFIASCVPDNGRDASIEEVRQALSRIPGALSEDIRAERDRR